MWCYRVHICIWNRHNALCKGIILICSSLFKNYFMCMSALPSCMYVYYMYAWCPWKTEEDIRSPGTGVTDGCKPPCRFWGTEPGSSARATSAFNHSCVSTAPPLPSPPLPPPLSPPLLSLFSLLSSSLTGSYYVFWLAWILYVDHAGLTLTRVSSKSPACLPSACCWG